MAAEHKEFSQATHQATHQASRQEAEQGVSQATRQTALQQSSQGERGRGSRSQVTNRKMFFTMLQGAIFRRRSRAIMAMISTLVGATTLFSLAIICLTLPGQMSAQMRAYGANLIVSPVTVQSASTSAEDSEGSSAGNTAEAGANSDGDTESSATSSAESEADFDSDTSESYLSVTEDIPTSVADQIDAVVAEFRSASSARYRYETVRVNNNPYMVAGIDAEAVATLNQHWTVEGEWPSSGNVMVGSDVAAAANLEIGSTITIGYREAEEGGDGTSYSTSILDTDGTRYRVSGILDTGGSEDSIIYMTYADLDELSEEERGFDVLEYSVLVDSEQLSALAEQLSELEFSTETEASSVVGSSGSTTETAATAVVATFIKGQVVTQITAADTRIITMLQTLFWLVSAVILVLTLVGVSTTMTSIVSQRRNEIGLRKALGATPGEIGREFYAESACYGLVGGLVGTVLGYGLALILSQTVFETSLAFNWPLGVVSVLVSMCLALAASYIPVRRASRIDPAVVLREE